MAEIDNKLNDPLNTAPKIPSVGEAIKQTQDITKQQVESTKRLGELEAQKLEKAPLIQKEKLEAEKAYRDTARQTQEADIASAEKDMSQFKVSQDSVMGMSALGTAILMLGQALGRSGGQQSAMGAIQGMTGMMQGYTEGRAAEFKRNQVEFERNFKILQDKIKRANDKFQSALAEMPYNTIDAQTKAAQALAELDSPILKEKYNKQGLVETAGFVKTLFDASQKAADRAQQLAIAKAKTTGGGSKSAINERFQNTVIRSANETLRSLELMENIGIDIGKGAFGGVVGKGTITSEAAANLSRFLTSQDQIRYNAAAGGMALELAYVLNGGYKPNETQIAELKNLYLATPQDTYESAAFKFADVVAKLKAAIEVAPAYTDQQKASNQMLLEKVRKYETPENILRKINGEEPKPDPYLRVGGKSETRRGKVTSGPNAGKTKIEYSDGTSEYVNE